MGSFWRGLSVEGGRRQWRLSLIVHGVHSRVSCSLQMWRLQDIWCRDRKARPWFSTPHSHFRMSSRIEHCAPRFLNPKIGRGTDHPNLNMHLGSLRCFSVRHHVEGAVHSPSPHAERPVAHSLLTCDTATSKQAGRRGTSISALRNLVCHVALSCGATFRTYDQPVTGWPVTNAGQTVQAPWSAPRFASLGAAD